MQLNFLNAELVKPGIRRRGEEGEKFCPFSRQDWKRGSAGMLSVLIKTMMHKTQCCRSPGAARRDPGSLRCRFLDGGGERKYCRGRAALSTCEVRPGDIKAQEIIHSAEGSSAAQQRRSTAAFYAARRSYSQKNRKVTPNVFHCFCFCFYRSLEDTD